MTTRCRCLVPFCKRTRGPRKGDRFAITDTFQWICGPHFKAVPASLRRRRARITRMMARASGERQRRLDDLDRRMWDRIREAAIERAGGLA
jgi:hypothetical protein